MTAPDLLGIIVARYPSEMVLIEAPAGWNLIIESPGLGMHVAVHALDRLALGEYAQHWERFRDSRLHGPRRCACGRFYGEHRWDSRSAGHLGECPDGVGRYRPAERPAAAVLPAEWSA